MTRRTPGTTARRQLGKSDAEIKTYLASLDTWDRYDFDHDGDFNEADGYIDHFQAVHAGGGEEAGAGDDAIWSHRWYVNPTDEGVTGPSGNLLGGTQIGTTGVWIGDYTVEPENGGLGVFTHEFGHDLGLPDYYDTNGGENSTGFWTLMSSGSWLNEGQAAGDAIGTTPGGFGPEEKRFLGWLDYCHREGRQSGDYLLGPSQNTYDGADQAVRVDLPNSTRTDNYVTPPDGHEGLVVRAWRRPEEHPDPRGAGGYVGHRVGRLWRAIEENFDYLYVEYSTDQGAHWTTLRPSPATPRSGRRRSGPTSRPAERRASSASGTPPTVGSTRPGRSSTTSRSRPGRRTRSPTGPRAAPTAGRPTAGRPRPAPR